MEKAKLADAIVLEVLANQAAKAAKGHQAALAPGEYEVLDGHVEATVREKGKRPRPVAYLFSGPVIVADPTPSKRSPSLQLIVAVLFARLKPAERKPVERAILAGRFDALTKADLDQAKLFLAQLATVVEGTKPRVTAAHVIMQPAE